MQTRYRAQTAPRTPTRPTLTAAARAALQHRALLAGSAARRRDCASGICNDGKCGSRFSPDYIGCYADDADRIMAHALLGQAPAMTLEMCRGLALGRRLAMYGTEGGWDCCGTDYLRQGSKLLPDAACSKPCTGNASQQCGGVSTISVYRARPYNGEAAGRPMKFLSAANPPCMRKCRAVHRLACVHHNWTIKAEW